MTDNERLLLAMFKCKGEYPEFTVSWLKEEFFNQKVLVIPQGVKVIGDRIIGYIYRDGKFIYPETQTVIIPDGVKEIESWAFASCNRTVKKVYIPQSVEIIGDVAFNYYGGTIYCEGEPQKGWIDKEPEMELNIYQGGTVYEESIRTHNNWNPNRRPVITNVSKEEFLKLLSEENNG